MFCIEVLSKKMKTTIHNMNTVSLIICDDDDGDGDDNL